MSAIKPDIAVAELIALQMMAGLFPFRPTKTIYMAPERERNEPLDSTPRIVGRDELLFREHVTDKIEDSENK